MHIHIPTKNISFHVNGKFYTVDSSNPSFSEVVDACLEFNYSKAAELSDVRTAVLEAIKDTGVTLDGDTLYYNKEAVSGLLGTRIVAMINLGISVNALVAFLENLMENPSKRAVEELYGFLEVSRLPITDDGYFLAYKSVRGDFTDVHSGTFDNSPGQFVSMPRNQVDEDKDRLCSNGLHFAAHEYAEGFSGARMVVLKINPRDVVAIPSDYNNQKGRCCAYTVVEEVARNNSDLVGAVVVASVIADTTGIPVDLFDAEDLFIGHHSEFPTDDFDTEYTLTRIGRLSDLTYDGKWVYDSSPATGSLVFRRKSDNEYLTVTDTGDWNIVLFDFIPF